MNLIKDERSNTSLVISHAFRHLIFFLLFFFFFSSRRRHTRLQGDWSSDVCSSDLNFAAQRSERVALSNCHSISASAKAARFGLFSLLSLSEKGEIGRASCRERV